MQVKKQLLPFRCASGSASDPLCSLNLIRFFIKDHGKKVANSVFGFKKLFVKHKEMEFHVTDTGSAAWITDRQVNQ